jgi:signal transduction histidine kinase
VEGADGLDKARLILTLLSPMTPNVFERFWRGKGVRLGGAGLALAIVVEIVRARGASIGVTNRVSCGARSDLRFLTA